MDGLSKGKYVVKNINAKLTFLHRQGVFVEEKEKQMFCSALSQPHVYYAWNTEYGRLEAVVKNRL